MTQVSRRELLGAAALAAAAPDASKTRSYNPDMEYRRLGRTGLMISVVSLGGHWKKIPFARNSSEFKANRRQVIYACLERGINYVDACSGDEVAVYAEALGDRRKEIYFGFDWTLGRKPEIAGSVERLKQGLDEGLKKSGLDHVDIWRITMREQTTNHAPGEIENIMEALAWGKKSGKARHTGVSTHHRPWIAAAVAKYPQMEVVITPYSAGSKAKPVSSMFDAFRKHDVGFIGIKPFASGTLFASNGVPDSPTKQDDDQRARLALRHALACDVLTASIPGLITVDQAKNAAAAVRERRQMDMAEAGRHRESVARMWRNLPAHYQWLKAWQWV